MGEARAYVAAAEIELGDGCDPAAVGAAVTVELCGHWEHEGPCRWPHNNAIDPGSHPAIFRTLFVADASDEPEVRSRIEKGLRAAGDWRMLSVDSRAVADHERELAERLLAGPRQEDAR